MRSRRELLQRGGAMLGAAFAVNRAAADPLGLPIGLQLYTVGAQMDKDFDGTLRRVAAIGYKQVELAGAHGRTAQQFRSALDANGLTCPSAHYALVELQKDLDDKIAFVHDIGAKYMICAAPWVADPSRFKADPKKGQFAVFIAVLGGMTLDDWKWNAEQFNRIGEATKKAGIQFGYHNHNFEFRSFGDATGYDELLKDTDPNLVKLEMDCGWVVVAGNDPIAYLKKYPDRYRLLHIKDFRPGFTPSAQIDSGDRPVPTELGRGAIDYAPIFAAAKGHVEYIFVEQEPPFKDMPPLEAIKVDYDYLHALRA